MSIPELFQGIKRGIRPPNTEAQGSVKSEELPLWQGSISASEEQGTGGGPRSSALSNILAGDLLLMAIVVLACTAAFGLGMLFEQKRGATEKHGIEVEQIPASALSASALLSGTPIPELPSSEKTRLVPAVAAKPATGAYVASKSGTAYYLATCAGAKRIKEENKVWFDTKAQAESKGLHAAKNCPGLE